MTGSEDLATPRNMGHFCLAIDPARFAGRKRYEAAMMRYVASLRGSVTRPGERVMAPGDREWAIEEERLRDGIPVDRETLEFLALV